MRWPGKLGRVLDVVQKLRDDRDRLAAELERERQQHADDVYALILGARLRAVQFGNVGEYVYPEQLAQFRQIAADGGQQAFVVSGAGRMHGVHWVGP